jgi:hypothetical protein
LQNASSIPFEIHYPLCIKDLGALNTVLNQGPIGLRDWPIQVDCARRDSLRNLVPTSDPNILHIVERKLKEAVKPAKMFLLYSSNLLPCNL